MIIVSRIINKTINIIKGRDGRVSGGGNGRIIQKNCRDRVLILPIGLAYLPGIQHHDRPPAGSMISEKRILTFKEVRKKYGFWKGVKVSGTFFDTLRQLGLNIFDPSTSLHSARTHGRGQDKFAIVDTYGTS